MQPLSLNRVVCMFSYQLARSILSCLSLSLFFYRGVSVNILNFGYVLGERHPMPTQIGTVVIRITPNRLGKIHPSACRVE